MFPLEVNDRQMRSLGDIKQKAELNGMEICSRDHPGFEFHLSSYWNPVQKIKSNAALCYNGPED